MSSSNSSSTSSDEEVIFTNFRAAPKAQPWVSMSVRASQRAEHLSLVSSDARWIPMKQDQLQYRLSAGQAFESAQVSLWGDVLSICNQSFTGAVTLVGSKISIKDPVLSVSGAVFRSGSSLGVTSIMIRGASEVIQNWYSTLTNLLVTLSGLEIQTNLTRLLLDKLPADCALRKDLKLEFMSTLKTSADKKTPQRQSMGRRVSDAPKIETKVADQPNAEETRASPIAAESRVVVMEEEEPTSSAKEELRERTETLQAPTSEAPLPPGRRLGPEQDQSDVSDDEDQSIAANDQLEGRAKQVSRGEALSLGASAGRIPPSLVKPTTSPRPSKRLPSYHQPPKPN